MTRLVEGLLLSRQVDIVPVHPNIQRTGFRIGHGWVASHWQGYNRAIRSMEVWEGTLKGAITKRNDGDDPELMRQY
jgi:hypothetical protein